MSKAVSRHYRNACVHPLALATVLSAIPAARAQQSDATTLDAITVTARLRAESIQDVPDSIVAFGENEIDRAGIDSIHDIADMVPNIIIRKAFRSGENNITIRGITSNRQGWPPVAFVVDGVKAGSVDAMQQGTLLDIERIEVLKGPQGALYGAGAIGGAINIITRQPSDYFQGRVQASYENGNNLKFSGGISGPIIENKLLYSISGFYNNSDGVVKIVDSKEAVDKRRQSTGRVRLLFKPTDDLSFDLRASIMDTTGRAPGSDKIDDPALVDEFRSSRNPGPTRRPGFEGYESREMLDVSLKTEVNLGFANFQSVIAYQDIKQNLLGSVNYEGGPVGAGNSLLGQETHGNAALPGQIIDEFQDVNDDFDTWSADFRLTSSGEQRLRWLVGAELMRRKYLASQTAGHLIAPDNTRDLQYGFDQWYRKVDDIWGVYGQLSYDITEKLELTLAGRYDRDDYRSGRIDPATNAFIPEQDANGILVDEVKTKDSAFTPKVQLSYHWAKEFMTYVTYSEGFRFGFYNLGRHALAESTKNYEMGFKSRLFDNRLTLNMAAFHIDYSDQQLTLTVATPPFRVTRNTPETKIDGFELDAMVQLTEKLSFSGGVGHTHAKVQDAAHHFAPVTPKWTSNASMQWFEPITDTLDFSARLDYRHQSSMYLRPDEVYPIKGASYMDLRIGLETLDYAVKFYVENLTDTQRAYSLSPFSGRFVRAFSLPRTYGVEVRYNF